MTFKFGSLSKIKSQFENRTKSIHIINKPFLISAFVVIN